MDPNRPSTMKKVLFTPGVTNTGCYSHRVLLTPGVTFIRCYHGIKIKTLHDLFQIQ